MTPETVLIKLNQGAEPVTSGQELVIEYTEDTESERKTQEGLWRDLEIPEIFGLPFWSGKWREKVSWPLLNASLICQVLTTTSDS